MPARSGRPLSAPPQMTPPLVSLMHSTQKTQMLLRLIACFMSQSLTWSKALALMQSPPWEMKMVWPSMATVPKPPNPNSTPYGCSNNGGGSVYGKGCNSSCNGVGSGKSWQVVPPSPGKSSTQCVSSKTFHLCAKCHCCTKTHSTNKHVGQSKYGSSDPAAQIALYPLAWQPLVWLDDASVATAHDAWDLFAANRIPGV